MAASRFGYLVMGAALALAIWPQAAPAAQAELANGVFLVAKPDLQDPNFQETVVLITQPQVDGGPLGVIINRPLGARLSEIIPGAVKLPEQVDAIYAGGPVRRDRVLFLVRTSNERPQHSLQVLEDVYLSGDRELLEQWVRGEAQAPVFRAYAGYSGWGRGQLQSEITRGGWYVIKADADIIFSINPSEIWPELIKRITTRRTAVPPLRENQLSKNSLTLSIHDLARGSWRPAPLTLIASSSCSSSF